MKKQAEEKLTKKSVTKTPEKKADKKKAAKPEKSSKKETSSKSKFKEGRLMGKYTLNSAKGKIVAQAMKAGKITEKEAKAIAKGKNVSRIFYRVRRFGKKSGYFAFFPSKKTDGLWIFKPKDMPKEPKKAEKKGDDE